MKVGKLVLNDVANLLKSAKIDPKYKSIFEIEKVLQWIASNQTYLTEFHVNDQPAIIALCSPIPGIGMALKLWAPVLPNCDEALSLSLFKRYIDYIEKSTTVPKIMFSGMEFKELIAADFTMKKERLYERLRKTAAKEANSEFEPFFYVECSNVRFAQNGPEKLLYSDEIEGFTT
jgi:hypothetical protein